MLLSVRLRLDCNSLRYTVVGKRIFTRVKLQYSKPKLVCRCGQNLALIITHTLLLLKAPHQPHSLNLLPCKQGTLSNPSPHVNLLPQSWYYQNARHGWALCPWGADKNWGAMAMAAKNPFAPCTDLAAWCGAHNHAM